jgi:hypothetical protein
MRGFACAWHRAGRSTRKKTGRIIFIVFIAAPQLVKLILVSPLMFRNADANKSKLYSKTLLLCQLRLKI